MVIPARGQKQLLEDPHTAHPRMVKMKNMVASYLWWPGQALKIRSSDAKYVSYVELHLLQHFCILRSGPKSPGPADI